MEDPLEAPDDASLATLRRFIEESAYTVVFTGAGISTESGIPDFRGPGGFWSKNRPIDFDEFLASEEARRESWRRKLAFQRTVGGVTPNRGHRAVAELVRTGRCACVVTQNIDGLHQRSGVPEERIVELHGNGTYAACLDCGARYDLAPIFDAFERDGTLPECVVCRGLVKTATISFGQPMPERAMALARKHTLACELFIVLGSSLVVHPAAGFPSLAKRSGARLAIVNREPTDCDSDADVVVRHSIGAVMGQVVGVE